MNDIIFICTGNTCRSPMAEALFRAQGGEQKTGLVAASAGLYTRDGQPASDNAALAASELGADLSAHRAQMLTDEQTREARYLVCMTGAHFNALRARLPDCADKLFTLLSEDVADPFGGDLQTYRAAAAQIEKGVAAVIERLTK